MHVRTAILKNKISVSYVGPPLESGPLPAVFYFALSALDSLTLDPFNQPVVELAKDENLRVFSMTLPGHEPPLKKEEAIAYWASHVKDNHDIITPFLNDACKAIEWLIEDGSIKAETTALMGLSRGGFIATHLAARMPSIDKVIAFAPVTKIEISKEFEEVKDHPIVRSLDLSRHMQKLCSKKLRFFIGNRDTRVGTKHCFEFISELAKLKEELREKKGSFHLTLKDSIGYLGHGTSQEVFCEGARIARKLIV